MWYHPASGEYVICEKADEVPDGYVDNLSKVGKDQEDDEKSKPNPNPRAKANAAKRRARSSNRKAGNDEPTGNGKVNAKGRKVVTLDDLETTREDVIEFLAEEGIDYDDKMTDDELATLASANIKD